MKHFVPFDSILGRVNSLLQAPGALPTNIPDLYLVRDLFGKVRNGPRELDSVVSEIFLGFQAAKSR